MLFLLSAITLIILAAIVSFVLFAHALRDYGQRNVRYDRQSLWQPDTR